MVHVRITGLRPVCVAVLLALFLGSGEAAQVTDPTHPSKPGEALYTASHALLIGNENYESWSNLPSVSGEVQSIASSLELHGFELHGGRVHYDLTGEQLVNLVSSFFKQHRLQRSTRLFFYYGGHGKRRKVGEGSRGYLVGVDAPRLKPGSHKKFVSRALSLDYLKLLAREVETSHVFVALDACQAGQILLTRSVLGASPISATVANPVVQILTAGGAEENVPGESMFADEIALALREGHADQNADGSTTGRELAWHLYEAVLDETGKHVGFDEIIRPGDLPGDVVFGVSRDAAVQADPKPEASPERPKVEVPRAWSSAWRVSLPVGTMATVRVVGHNADRTHWADVRVEPAGEEFLLSDAVGSANAAGPFTEEQLLLVRPRHNAEGRIRDSAWDVTKMADASRWILGMDDNGDRDWDDLRLEIVLTPQP